MSTPAPPVSETTSTSCASTPTPTSAALSESTSAAACTTAPSTVTAPVTVTTASTASTASTVTAPATATTAMTPSTASTATTASASTAASVTAHAGAPSPKSATPTARTGPSTINRRYKSPAEVEQTLRADASVMCRTCGSYITLQNVIAGDTVGMKYMWCSSCHVVTCKPCWLESWTGESDMCVLCCQRTLESHVCQLDAKDAKDSKDSKDARDLPPPPEWPCPFHDLGCLFFTTETRQLMEHLTQVSSIATHQTLLLSQAMANRDATRRVLSTLTDVRSSLQQLRQEVKRAQTTADMAWEAMSAADLERGRSFAPPPGQIGQSRFQSDAPIWFERASSSSPPPLVHSPSSAFSASAPAAASAAFRTEVKHSGRPESKSTGSASASASASAPRPASASTRDEKAPAQPPVPLESESDDEDSQTDGPGGGAPRTPSAPVSISLRRPRYYVVISDGTSNWDLATVSSHPSEDKTQEIAELVHFPKQCITGAYGRTMQRLTCDPDRFASTLTFGDQVDVFRKESASRQDILAALHGPQARSIAYSISYKSNWWTGVVVAADATRVQVQYAFQSAPGSVLQYKEEWIGRKEKRLLAPGSVTNRPPPPPAKPLTAASGVSQTPFQFVFHDDSRTSATTNPISLSGAALSITLGTSTSTSALASMSDVATLATTAATGTVASTLPTLDKSASASVLATPESGVSISASTAASGASTAASGASTAASGASMPAPTTWAAPAAHWVAAAHAPVR